MMAVCQDPYEPNSLSTPKLDQDKHSLASVSTAQHNERVNQFNVHEMWAIALPLEGVPGFFWGGSTLVVARSKHPCSQIDLVIAPLSLLPSAQWLPDSQPDLIIVFNTSSLVARRWLHLSLLPSPRNTRPATGNSSEYCWQYLLHILLWITQVC